MALTLLVGNQDYNSAGMHMVKHYFEGDVRPEAFLMKMIFTALTIDAGFKSDEIVPSFFTGASFGCLFGIIASFFPPLCTAIDMVSVFCGVTNC